MESSFFSPGSVTREGQIASLHLSRDQLLAVKLSTVASKAENQGYAEGMVENTRFGSFPHSTLINVPWGYQVLASKVDTGTRGRATSEQSKKRKASAISTDSPGDSAERSLLKQAITATSGFIHVLPPTPESWTTSLPHRTQVVYTPDYSYILQRIRARPGSTLIEAGSGSGSFTHASARAVFQGISRDDGPSSTTSNESQSQGKVYTFEFHAERHEKVKAEMVDHGLDSIVTATHRDVYQDGFWIRTHDGQYLSPRAKCIFLDLPAPWEALPHLTREETATKPSALDSNSTIYICTFSPCIEQVQKTISAMRRQGWLEIEMMEIQHKRIDVRRDFTGLDYEGMRGVNAAAADVNEALARLEEVEGRSRELSDRQDQPSKPNKSKAVSQQNKQQSAAQECWDQGRLVHRSEPELKTHTSYLVFAILPRDWTDEDEDAASSLTQETVTEPPAATQTLMPRKQQKHETKQKRQMPNGAQTIAHGNTPASQSNV